MTIVRRMLSGYVGLLFLLLVVAGVGMSGLYWLDSRFGEYNESARVQSQGAAAIRLAAAPMRYITAAGVLTDDEALRAAYTAELESAFDATLAAIDSMIAVDGDSGDAADLALLEDLKAQLEEYHVALVDVIELASTNRAMPLYNLNVALKAQGNRFDGAVVAYADAQNAEVLAGADSLSNKGNAMIAGMAVAVVLALVAGILLQLFASRDIGRRLRGAVASLGSSTAEIMAIASQVAAGATQTAASTNEATVTVEEVKQTAMLAHEKASSAAQGAQGAMGVIGSARSLVDETASGIERMQSEMDVLFETINSLGERTQAAGEIIASVNDLAEQSNLLSVNASIEAAKAGEHGRGFAVVAQEVKSLAEQSKQAVAQVRTMLGEIQKASEKAVQAAASGREAVEAGKRQALEAGDVMQRVADGAGDDAESSLQVVASSRQQMAGMEQIGQAIMSINQATAQSVSGTRQVEKEVRQLQDLAVSLRSLVEHQAKSKRESAPENPEAEE